MASRMGWYIYIGKMIPCKQYDITKTRQKSVNKTSSTKKAERPCERLLHNIATIKALRKSGLVVARPNWHAMVDKYTEIKVAAFFTWKNNIN
jgi:hypothetical protein